MTIDKIEFNIFGQHIKLEYVIQGTVQVTYKRKTAPLPMNTTSICNWLKGKGCELCAMDESYLDDILNLMVGCKGS